MRPVLFLLFLAVGGAVFGEAHASVVVFAPEGALVTLSTSQGTQKIDSNVEHSLEAGPVELAVIHPDYEPYTRSWKLEPEQKLVLIPRLRSSKGYWLSQKESLLSLRERARSQQEGYSLAALGAGAAALAGWATVGGLEWSLANKKDQLSDAQAAYRGASVDQVASTWSKVEALKVDIGTLRNYEAYAATTSGVLSLGALALWLLGPDTGRWDDALRRLEEKGL